MLHILQQWFHTLGEKAMVWKCMPHSWNLNTYFYSNQAMKHP